MTVMFQVARIRAISDRFPVQINVDRKSKKIQIQGQSESITPASEAIHSIFHEVEKEARSQLEAEMISKEVIANFLVIRCVGWLVTVSGLVGKTSGQFYPVLNWVIG